MPVERAACRIAPVICGAAFAMTESTAIGLPWE